MDISLAIVMLSKREALDEAFKKHLEDTMRADGGIVSVGIPPHLPRVMLVAYNPVVTSARDILNRVGSTGLQAKLVGCG
jgi:hypothetical protein